DRRAQASRRPRRTTNRQERHLRLLAFRDHYVSTNSVAAAWYNVVDPVVTMPTIYRRRINWDAQWNSVVFSDESRFCLGMQMDDRGSGDYVENGAIQLFLWNGMWPVLLA
ncbi:hypothetical protein BDFB_003852, partial [Asbolus verrucosus]